MTVVQLMDAIFSIASEGDDTVICAREPFAWGTEAVIASFTHDFRIPEEVRDAGFSYFLRKEDVLRLLQQVAVKRASRETQAEFVAHFAMFDAYPRWFNDLPNR